MLDFIKENPIPFRVSNQCCTYCKKNIAKYAMPRDIEFRDQLPKTLVGKVAYRVLEEEELKKQDSFGGQISAEDLDKANILPTLVNQISLPMIKGFQENKTPIQEALPIMTKHMLTKSGISKFVNKRDLQQDAEKIENNDYEDSLKMIRYALLQSFSIEKKIPFRTTYEITILFQNSTEEVDIKKLTKDLAKEL